MTGVSDGLWMAACTNAVAALALTALGRQPQRGWGLWQAAAWLGTAGIAIGVLAQGSMPMSAPAGWLLLAQLLMLPWPVLTLIGLRRFHARVDWPGRARFDALLLAVGAAGVLASALAPADSAIGPLLAPLAVLLVHLYVASLLVCIGAQPDARPLLLLAAVVALAAAAPVWAALPHADASALALFESCAIATALATLCIAFILIRLRFVRGERQLRASQRRLRALAGVDGLTQMPDRRHFENLTRRALAHDAPGSSTLMLFDVDHFKQINAAFGHDGGDHVLRLVARCVRQMLRAQDVACRHGGDVFALLLRDASVHDAMRVATRLVAAVQTRAGSTELPLLSLSFGIVQVRPAEHLAQALERADQALFEAKRQGRSRAVASGGHDSEAPFIASRPLGLTSA